MTKQVFAFSYDFATDGSKIKWTSTSQILYLNTQNSSGLSDSSVQSIFNSSITQWNSISGVSLSFGLTSSSPNNNLNDIYFSSSDSILSGNGVLAVTQVGYQESTGRIVEADIIINDNYNFSSSPMSNNYLGDVLTHELGHFMGLGHSEVQNSSMVFELGGGQSTIANDDILGVRNLYQLASDGYVSGKVVAKEFTPVLGAHVEFISRTTGRVIAGVFSNYDGDFSLYGINEDFLVSISPVKHKESLSSYYKYARSDFCTSSTDYVRSFLQGCNKSREGHPLIIQTSSLTNGSLGNISIRCNTEVPVNYMLGKDSQYDFEFINQGYLDKNAFVGYVSNDQIDSSIEDKLEIDLSTYTVSNTSTYLRLNFSANEFFSNSVYTIKVTDGIGSVTNYSFQTSSDGKVTSDRTITLWLSNSNSLRNKFTIELTPKSLEDFIISNPSYRMAQILPGFGTLDEKSSSYLVMADLVNLSGTKLLTDMPFKYTDESLCLDGRVPFQSTSLINQSYNSKKSSAKKDEQGVACGSIDTGSGPQNGPFIMMLGFFLIMFFSSRRIQRI